MLFCDIGLIDEDFMYQNHVWVGVHGSTITYLGYEEPTNAAIYGEKYDGRDKLLMPALYNAHAHAPMTLLRGYAENLPLQDWLQQKCWPFEGKMTADDNYWGCLLALAEMARFGIVSMSDMYYFTAVRAKAVEEAGMKANLCVSPIAFEPKPIQEYPVYEEIVDSIATLHRSADDRIRIDACIHAEYTSNDITAQSTVALAAEQGLRLHLHVAETESETQECRQRHEGKSPVQWLESIGGLDIPVVAAHCVWVDSQDIALMAQHDVTVAHNPASNMKLASGFAPIAQLLDAGVNVALGTDGMASNNNHDMFQDMYLMALLPKGNLLDPAVVTPAHVLRAATRGGALAQGRDNCGLVKQGYNADLCVLDTSGVSWCPANDVPTNIVYAGHGSDVVLTMCDGAVVYRDGEWPTIDVEQAKVEVSERSARIQAELV